MGVMSGFEKFVVNSLSERNALGVLRDMKNHLLLPDRSTVLELGAGRGALSYLLVEYYEPHRMVVTDYDPAQLEEARSYFRGKMDSIPSNVEFRPADALNLNFEAESFDAVFAIHILHHTESHEWQFRNIPRALDQIHVVLKKDGCLVYAELFNKNRIKRHLRLSGFEEVFVKRKWMISDFGIFRKSLSTERTPFPISQ